jgi:hypothetical protein
LAFINFFCSGGQDSQVVLEMLFRSIFEMVPYLQSILYFMPDSVSLFAPFSSLRPALKGVTKSTRAFFTQIPPVSGNLFPYLLQACQRSKFYPNFVVRRARVEDCDDLIPILTRNRLLNKSQGDHFMSDLLESRESTRAIVAEVDGDVVGFMCIDRTTNQALLRETYDLEAFDNLVKILDIESSTTFTVTEQHLNVQNTFHVTLFCIDPQYGALSDQFLHFAFGIWPDLEYCALTVSETGPESPLLRYCSPIPSITANLNHKLYLANKFALRGVVEVQKLTAKHEEQALTLVRGMTNVDDFMNCISCSVDQSEGIKPYQVFVATLEDRVVASFVMEYSDASRAQALTTQFDIEKICDSKYTNLQDSYCIARYMIVNPLFETQARYICREIMRQLQLNCILFATHADIIDLASKRIATRDFVPVKPRRMIIYPNNIRDGDPVPSSIMGNVQIITQNLLLQPRMLIHTPIVVVGGSDTAISFLENLIFVGIFLLKYSPHTSNSSTSL